MNPSERPNPSQASDIPTDDGQHASADDVTRRQLMKWTVAGAAGMLAYSAPGPVQAGPLRDFLENRRTARSRRHTAWTQLKQNATMNYRRSFARFGGQLASGVAGLHTPRAPGRPYEFEIAVIGSGYGGSICAARLAQRLAPGMRLCVLERGREWVPGEFPDRFRDVLKSNRLEFSRRRPKVVKNPLGLVNFSRSDQFDVITGSGLGGTSLLNAAVAVRPDAEVFRQPHWPAALRDAELLEPYFQLAAWELGAETVQVDETLKVAAMRRAAQRLRVAGRSFETADLTIALRNGYPPMTVMNQHEVYQQTCVRCGDCIAGCNVGAKNTTQMNYLPMAKAAGAEIYTQVEVERIEKCQGYYRLHYLYHAGGQGSVVTSRHSTTARVVILAGGSLGSTELLLRSQSAELQFSTKLGCGWSGNGDALGFITRTGPTVNSAGFGTYCEDQPDVGPTIQSIIRTNQDQPVHQRLKLEDGSMPRAYANVIGTLMRDMDMEHVMVVFGMGHDGNKGRIVLKNNLAYVDWPGAKSSKYREYIRHNIERLANSLGGKYRYLRMFGGNLVTVHPLGGCNMSDDPRYGVSDDLGQVYDGQAGGYADASGLAAVHEGLFVVDGSMVPGSLGANPMLTISALAERTSSVIPQMVSMADMFVT